MKKVFVFIVLAALVDSAGWTQNTDDTMPGQEIEGTWKVVAPGVGSTTYLFERPEWDTNLLGPEHRVYGHLLPDFDLIVVYDTLRNTLTTDRDQYRVVWIDGDHFRTEGARYAQAVFNNAVWTRQTPFEDPEDP